MRHCWRTSFLSGRCLLGGIAHCTQEFDGALVILGGSAGARYLTQALTLHVNSAPPVLCRTPHPLSFTRGRESGLAPFVQSSQFSDITLVRRPAPTPVPLP